MNEVMEIIDCEVSPKFLIVSNLSINRLAGPNVVTDQKGEKILDWALIR